MPRREIAHSLRQIKGVRQEKLWCQSKLRACPVQVTTNWTENGAETQTQSSDGLSLARQRQLSPCAHLIKQRQTIMSSLCKILLNSSWKGYLLWCELVCFVVVVVFLDLECSSSCNNLIKNWSHIKDLNWEESSYELTENCALILWDRLVSVRAQNTGCSEQPRQREMKSYHSIMLFLQVQHTTGRPIKAQLAFAQGITTMRSHHTVKLEANKQFQIST